MQNRVLGAWTRKIYMTPERLPTVSSRAISRVLLAILFCGAIHLASANQGSKAPAPLRISTKSLPPATVGVEYYAVIAATGGEPPYDCIGKGLPPNIAFHPSSDTLGGKATSAGSYPVVITVEDSADPQHTASASFTLTVMPAK
jgi:hypothetical protein